MIFVAPQHYLPGSLEAHHNVRRLVNLLDNYRLISSQIIGLADKSFPHNPEHAQALRGFHYAISTAFGLFSRSDTARCKVLLGIGTFASIPAMFWSSPVAFERAAFNLAHFYGYAPEDGDKFTQFVEHMYNTTAMVRFDLYASGAFVGRLPLTYKADVAINVSSSGYRMYRAKWRHLPATAVFFYNGWGDEVLCFRTVSMEDSGDDGDQSSDEENRQPRKKKINTTFNNRAALRRNVKPNSQLPGPNHHQPFSYY